MESKKLNVLLVDDDEINQLVACTFLKKWDIGVTVATDGQKALDLILSKSFHLVMMDLQMPEMDGYECTRRIRQMDDPYFRNIPILVFSASAMIDSQKKATQFGMTDFINKPFRQEELRAKIGQYVKLPLPDFRPLNIDYSLHTDGEPFFKIELLLLLTDNLSELRRSLELSLKTGVPSEFLNACHKVSSAISILNDPELSTAVEALRSCLKAGDKGALDGSVSRFRKVTDENIRSMEHEVTLLKKMTQQP